MEEKSSFYMFWFFTIAVFNQLEKNLFIILSRRRDNQYTMTINMNCLSIFFFSKSRKFEGVKLALNMRFPTLQVQAIVLCFLNL